MKEYPSIDPSAAIPFGHYGYCFFKLDGSNLRCQWSKKKGWHLWGTRKRLFNATDPEYGQAIVLFEKKYAEPLAKAITDYKEFHKPQEAIAFMEFYGPHSFAGWHDPQALQQIGFNIAHNDPKTVTLFDVNIHKRGIVGPKNFLKAFGHLDIAEKVWEGLLDEQLVEDVRQSKIVTGEGVVVKGGEGHKLWMVKIKTYAYLKELRNKFGVGYQKYWE